MNQEHPASEQIVAHAGAMNPNTMNPGALDLARRLCDDVLRPIKAAFVGKDEVVDLMGVCLVGGENLFLHGPPGTAKSALVRELAMRIEGNVFDHLLTRFTEPNELFGPRHPQTARRRADYQHRGNAARGFAGLSG